MTIEGMDQCFLASSVGNKVVGTAFSSLKQFRCNSDEYESLVEPSWFQLNYDTDGSGSLHAAKAS